MELYKFIDGKDVYQNLNEEYKRHKKGYVILVSPEINIDNFIDSQDGKKNWLNAEKLFNENNLNNKYNNTNGIEKRLYGLRCDYMLEQSKLYGYRMLSSFFWEYKANAIVVPDIDKSDLISNSIYENIRNIFFYHGSIYKIPIFNTIKGAIEHLEKK